VEFEDSADQGAKEAGRAGRATPKARARPEPRDETIRRAGAPVLPGFGAINRTVSDA